MKVAPMPDDWVPPVSDDDIDWSGTSEPDPQWTRNLRSVPRPPKPGAKPPPAAPAAPARIPPEELEDWNVIAERGRALRAAGVPYVVEDLIPDDGVLGFLVAYAKVGKTTLALQLAAMVATGAPFLDRTTKATKVLILAAEDPPRYIDWIISGIPTVVPDGSIVVRCLPLRLGQTDLDRIVQTVRDEGIGLVLIASWQAVIRGLVRDENDNAGVALIVEQVKAAARQSHVPWLIDAHSGKGESQDNDADPMHAMRGASAAAGAADFTVSLRYADSPSDTKRRLSAKGRFVSMDDTTLDLDPDTRQYVVLGDSKTAAAATVAKLIRETGALTTVPQSARELALRIGLQQEGERTSKRVRQQIADALRGRADVGRTDELRRGQKTACYRLLGGE